MFRNIHIKIIITILLCGWCLGIILPVYSHSNDLTFISTIFMNKFYSLVCHQDPAKSFFINGYKLEVCARCTGIYFGGLLFAILSLFIPIPVLKNKKLLLTAIVPMLADVILYSIGVYSYSKSIAFITGFILGSVCILYIFVSIEQLFSEIKLSSDVQ
jgi:uncharacterized membrane protein